MSIRAKTRGYNSSAATELSLAVQKDVYQLQEEYFYAVKLHLAFL